MFSQTEVDQIKKRTMAKNSTDAKIEMSVEMIELTRSSNRSQNKLGSMFRKPTEENDEEINDDASYESEDMTSTSDSIGFWLMALSAQFGTNVLFSAAHDLIDNNFVVKHHIDVDKSESGRQISVNITHSHGDSHSDHDSKHFRRDCNDQSTGNFLLVSVVPELIAHILATLIPFHRVHLRMLLTICLSFIGFIVAAKSHSSFLLKVGVGLTSFSAGIAGNTFLSYISRFDNKHLILILFSGSGSAALLGSLWYVCSVALEFNYSIILYSLLVMPLLTGFAFWGLLNRPALCCFKEHIMIADQTSSDELATIRNDEGFVSYLHTVRDHLYSNVRYIPNLYQFIFSTSLVCFFDFYIRECLHELLYFNSFFLSHSGQYRWYQVTHNTGAFLVNSSLYFIDMDSLWCFPFLQALNASFLTLSAIYFIIPHFSLALCFVFWEGLMGAYMYTTIFIVLHTNVDPERRTFSMGIVAIASAVGVTLAALVAEPAHNLICNLPEDLAIY